MTDSDKARPTPVMPGSPNGLPRVLAVKHLASRCVRVMHREPGTCRVHRYARCVCARSTSDRFLQRQAKTIVKAAQWWVRVDGEVSKRCLIAPSQEGRLGDDFSSSAVRGTEWAPPRPVRRSRHRAPSFHVMLCG